MVLVLRHSPDLGQNSVTNCPKAYQFSAKKLKQIEKNGNAGDIIQAGAGRVDILPSALLYFS